MTLNHALIVLMLAVCIGFPLGYAWRLWRLDEPSRAAWLLSAAVAVLTVFLVMVIGRWDMAGAYTRWGLLTLFAVALGVSLRRHVSRPWRPAQGRSFWRSHMNALASVLLTGAAAVYMVWGLAPREAARPLTFPLAGGRFMIAQGGANPLLNYHNSHRAQRFAADITAVGPMGFRAEGLLPTQLEDYRIYGARVVSPCDGQVIAARDGLPDLTPPRRDPENAGGNHVVIDCGGLHVELAHLMRGSLRTHQGARLSAGDPVGRVGNSGNTTEPHLHIHAVDPTSGKGVPMSFDGAQPVRNAVFRR